MQPMSPCLFSGRPFKDTFENSQWRKVKQMQPTHSGQRSNKCNQCDYESSRADVLRTHLKNHSGEKLNKCNQCDYVSSWAINLRTHLKTHSAQCVHCTVFFPLDRARWDTLSNLETVILLNIYLSQRTRSRGTMRKLDFREPQTLNL